MVNVYSTLASTSSSSSSSSSFLPTDGARRAARRHSQLLRLPSLSPMSQSSSLLPHFTSASASSTFQSLLVRLLHPDSPFFPVISRLYSLYSFTSEFLSSTFSSISSTINSFFSSILSTLNAFTFRLHRLHSIQRQKFSATSSASTNVSELSKEMKDTATEMPLLPNEEDKRILLLNSRELLKEISEKKLRVSQIVDTFLRQALRAHKQCNCLSESLFVSARDEARKLDEFFERRGKLKGRLHGVVVCVADSVDISGVPSSLGLAKSAFQLATEDAMCVSVLRGAGAVVLAKTTVAQAQIAFECSSPLLGRTLNPYHPELSSGGAAGGAAATVAARGGVVVVASDIGGSLRIPAHFCGVFAMKTTARRMSTLGMAPPLRGQEAIPAVGGVIGNSVTDLIVVLRELLTKAVWDRDHEVVPLSLDDHECMNNDKLRIGYYVDDGFLPPSPACARAVQMTVDALRRDGHTVSEFHPPPISEAIYLFYQLLAADEGVTLLSVLHDEVREDYVDFLLSILRFPSSAKQAAALVLNNIFGEKELAKLLEAMRPLSVDQLWTAQSQRKKYRQQFFDAWQQHGHRFDIVITPAHVLPAIPHHSYKNISFAANYTMLQNLLDLPAGVVPITVVKEEDEYDFEKNPPKNVLERIARKYYDPKGIQKGLPIGVQVMALPFEDETVLRGMRIIADLLPWKAKPQTFGLE